MGQEPTDSPREMASRVTLKQQLCGKVGAYNFSDLIAAEESWLDARCSNKGKCGKTWLRKVATPADSTSKLELRRTETRERDRNQGRTVEDKNPEPWVSSTSKDRFGLALSGGGIRSATFNLGLLQALAREVESSDVHKGEPRCILDLVDYLATVSGGGYVGGFWTRWLCELARCDLLANREQPLFPQTKQHGERLLEAEPDPVRHLRERSRFLIPRVGLLESQTWAAIVTILGATIPSLMLAAASLTLFWAGFVLVLWGMLNYPFWAFAGFGLLTTSILFLRERDWTRSSENRHCSGARYYRYALIAGIFGGAIYFAAPKALDLSEGAVGFAQLISHQRFLDGTNIRSALPAMTWVSLAMGLLLVVRPVFSETLKPFGLRVLERLVARCLVPALFWSFLLVVWWSARHANDGQTRVTSTAVAASTLGATGVFIWFKDWLNKPIRETHGTRLLDRVMVIVKPLTPQLLAYAVSAGMLWLAALAVIALGRAHGSDALQRLAAIDILVLVIALLTMDPTRIGLHEFYRSRIAATFLGGYSSAGGDSARGKDPFVSEDVTFGKLAELPATRRPLHLVCTTANHLSGDALPNLYRGGSSLTLSPIAMSIGNYAVPEPDIQLSSALTASAAAFNSQMGAFSKRLGPAVAFIMSALGLRLGLWVQHPAARRGGAMTFPGRYFFEEMLGRSDSYAPTAVLHLSDGGHFENLALYELVRRHCRYIIVSDCGADAEVAFDDLANATRRIREDFGIEIEIDVDPLRPNGAGLSQQHAVVGTIHYDGMRGSDKGVLIYFKPTIVGNEPTDVIQYRRRNAAFPHESTGDQFYDEAQWESYRRLGEHCGRTVFRFVDDAGLTQHGNVVERLFLGAIERWQSVRGADRERLRQLVQERDELLNEMRHDAPDFLQAELFAELVATRAAESPAAGDRQLLDAMHYCIRITTLMDRVYQAAQLETSWSHGSNQAWMTFFGRCCAAPTFRNWWPLLRPWSSNGLRDFVKLRFRIRIFESARADVDRAAAVVELSLSDPTKALACPASYAKDSWIQRFGKPDPNSMMLPYIARFEGVPSGLPARELVVGFLIYREDTPAAGHAARKVISFSSAELYVPDTLNGAGFSSRLLDAVVAHFQSLAGRKKMPIRIVVEIADEPPRGTVRRLHRDPAHRQARRDSLHFFKSRGFEQLCDDGQRMLLKLDLSPQVDRLEQKATETLHSSLAG